MTKSIWKHVDSNFINQWSNVISHLPWNIDSFTKCYLNNTLADGINVIIKWVIANNSACKFCDEQQTLGPIIGGCRTPLELRYYWRHKFILLHINKTIKYQQGLEVLVDIASYPNQSVITTEDQWSNFIFRTCRSIQNKYEKV